MRIFGLIVVGVANIAATVVNLVVWIAVLTSSLSGCVNPEHIGWAGLLAMALPVTLGLLVVTMIVDAIFFRWLAVPTGIVLALCMPSMAEIFPLNFSGPKYDSENSWTLLTYNIHLWRDMSGKYEGDTNPTAQYILSRDADVVCLQEAERLDTISRRHLDREIIDEFAKKYPTIISSNHCVFMSKYPAVMLPLESISRGNGRGEVTGFRVNIRGHAVDIFSVHLRSHYLSPENKALYHDLTTLNTESHSMDDVQEQLVNKLSDGNIVRADQARQLANFIVDNSQRDVVVCGDFNDVPTCYPLRTLQKIGLRQVWAARGLGYEWTFNRDRFLFRIDHVLWRGDFYPLEVSKGRVKSSDHYPLEVTFTMPRQDTDSANRHCFFLN